MSNIDVEEFLKTTFDGKDSNWKPADKMLLISSEIERIKDDVKIYLDNTDKDIASTLDEGKELCAESEALLNDMMLCETDIVQDTMAAILQSVKIHESLVKELVKVNFSLDIMYDVVQCGKYIKEYSEAREAESFSKGVENIFEVIRLLETPAEGFQELDLYTNTKVTVQMILEKLLLDLSAEWERMVSWTVKPGPRKTLIAITLNVVDNLNTVDILNALDKSDKLSEKVQEFAQFLLKDVLVPIINNECTVLAESEELMTVTISHKNITKPQYDTVISNLRLLFHYLSKKLNIEFMGDNTIMNIIGKKVSTDFRDILVKDCLIDTIPNNINELQNYGKITAEIEDFQRFLTTVRIFPNEQFSILHYVDNIDILFARKSSQYFLETARTIMLKDLSLTMSIGVESIPEEQSVQKLEDDNVEEALKILDKTLPKSLFYFPRCMISKTAQELLDLIYVIMEQAVQCSDVVCKKLYQTTRLVFELYDAVVPYHHENYLQTIPQYVALFHNNCMYLAHNLQTFGDKWLMLMEGRELDYAISFVDLVQKLRDLGYKHLTIHMQQQRKQILDNIRSSDLNSIVVKDVLGKNAEAAVRQCLRQLQLLKNVWIGVFPANVFARLMGTLVNMFVDELIHRVCTAEDISAEMAGQLTDIYTLVVQKAPALFQSPNDVEKYVKTWVKLQELIFVLGGTLKDIEAHWAEGSGPLAVHFRTEELRNLVKALFQNTQFRANLLSKIK